VLHRSQRRDSLWANQAPNTAPCPGRIKPLPALAAEACGHWQARRLLPQPLARATTMTEPPPRRPRPTGETRPRPTGSSSVTKVSADQAGGRPVDALVSAAACWGLSLAMGLRGVGGPRAGGVTVACVVCRVRAAEARLREQGSLPQVRHARLSTERVKSEKGGRDRQMVCTDPVTARAIGH
jgi:hypothetical protein